MWYGMGRFRGFSGMPEVKITPSGERITLTQEHIHTAPHVLDMAENEFSAGDAIQGPKQMARAAMHAD